MAYIYDLADTWNASGTTFTGIKLNVTDTASAAGSLLMDLQVGGVSKFRVDKSGFIRVDGGSVGDAAIKIGNPNTGFFGINTSAFGLVAGNVEVARFLDVGELRLPSAVFLSWNADTRLYRDAANTLAQRNGVNAQAFNLYNTYTDASNYERGFMRWVSNALQIGSDKLGTGTARGIEFRTDGTARLTISAAGSIDFAAGFSTVGNAGFGTGIVSGALVRFAASTTSRSHLRLVAGAAPSAPADGDIWFDGTDIKMQIGGVTKTFTLT